MKKNGLGMMKKGLITLMMLSVLIFSIPVFADSTGKTGCNTAVTMTSANTEYSWTIPNGVSAFTVRCRGAYDVKFSFTSGTSGTTYWTVSSGNSYYETSISSYNNTLYMQCATAAQVVEIIYWM